MIYDKEKKIAIKNQPHVPKTINKSKNIPKQEKAKKQIQMKIGFLKFFLFYIYSFFKPYHDRRTTRAERSKAEQ